MMPTMRRLPRPFALLGALVASALATGCATPPDASAPAAAPASAPSPATVQAHVAEATRLAGDDKGLLSLCQPQPEVRASGSAVDATLQRLIALPPPAPGQAFDNLYYVGGAWSSAWVLKTSQGLVLIDTLNHAQEASALIEGGLAKLGLDPRDIRYIVLTHGHGDHYGGAPMLVEKYRPRVVATEADWRMMEGALEFTSQVWPAPPKRDVAVSDGHRLTLGDTTLTLYATPGHTMGTISPVFEVREGGRVHRAMLWGGTAFNFGRDLPRLDAYHASVQRMRRLAAENGVDVMLSNHPNYDGSLAKFAALRDRPAAAPHPFVIGAAAVDRALAAMGECALAQRDRFMLSALR